MSLHNKIREAQINAGEMEVIRDLHERGLCNKNCEFCIGEAVEASDLSIIEAYREGFLAGIRCFAHMQSGVYYVGTTGKTLKEAEAGVEKLWNYNPPQRSA